MTGSGPFEWLTRPALEVLPTGPVHGIIAAPSSKSLTNRLLVIAGLANGRSELSNILDSDDTVAMMDGLRSLGASIDRAGSSAQVTGTSGRVVANGSPLNAGLSGTTLRFLSAVALLAEGTVVIDGAEPLRRRPIAPLLETLRAAGAQVDTDSGRPPLRISGHHLEGGSLRVDASASSQFATALLLVGPYAREDLILEVDGLAELGYVRLTLDVMRRWGATATEEATGQFRVLGGTGYEPRAESVEHDASAAAHLYALAVATGGSVTVSNAQPSAQPDAGILELFAAMGASFTRGPDGTTLERTGGLTGVTADLGAMPDQVPTLAVIGALAQGDTVIRGAAIARGHETDRIRAVATELGRLGANVEEAADGLVVHGGAKLHGGRVRTYHDHRIAMAFTALGAVVPGVEIAEPGCVAKTYPEFFVDVSNLGVGLR